MRDDKDRAAVHQRVHAALHDGFGARVDRAGGLVENHNGRVGDRRAGDGDELALALRKAAAVAGKHGVVAVGQHADEAVGVRELRRGDALLVGGAQLAVSDILHHGAGEEVDVLQNHAERAAQVGLFDLIDIDAVVADLAVGDVVEAVDEVRDRRLACAGRADEGNFLARLRVERNVVQHDLVGHVAEIHPVELHTAGKLGVGYGSVAVRVLPRPEAGVLFGLDKRIAAPFRVDERHIALVLLAFLVEQRKDTGGAGHCHDDRRDLLRHLTDRLHKAARELEEGGDRAERHHIHAGEHEIRRAGKGHEAAEHGDQHV